MVGNAYVIPTREFYKDFLRSVGSMTCMDVDQDELFNLMVQSLENPNWATALGKPAWDQFAQSYRNYGGWSGEPTPDGEILASAIYNFQSKLLDLLISLGFFTAFGLLPFRYDRMIGGDMVLIDASKTE